MCIAVAARIIMINSGGKTARVDMQGNEFDVNVTLITPVVGDYVLIHAGCAIEIIKEDTAAEITELYRLLEEAAGEY